MTSFRFWQGFATMTRRPALSLSLPQRGRAFLALSLRERARVRDRSATPHKEEEVKRSQVREIGIRPGVTK
jgi:hypothetical protein